MVSSKLTKNQLERAANKLKAIAHPARLSIISYLMEPNRLTVKEIHENLNLEQSAASHHLGMLKDKGILDSKREGKHIYYSLKDKNFSTIIECLKKM